jgi:hypothetical protein
MGIYMTPNTKQVGGTHYQTGATQHWDIAAMLYGETHFKCTATKYVSRWRKKAGVQDLEKAKHYLEKLGEIANWSDLEDRLSVGTVVAIMGMELDLVDSELIIRIFEATDVSDLKACIQSIDTLIAGQTAAKPA